MSTDSAGDFEASGGVRLGAAASTIRGMIGIARQLPSADEELPRCEFPEDVQEVFEQFVSNRIILSEGSEYCADVGKERCTWSTNPRAVAYVEHCDRGVDDLLPCGHLPFSTVTAGEEYTCLREWCDVVVDRGTLEEVLADDDE